MDISIVNDAVNNALTGSSSDNSNVLSGVVLAGDSWLANNQLNTPFIQNQLGSTPVTNVAVGGYTSGDTLSQLNNFIGSGGSFAPGTTVVLDAGGNDLLNGVPKDQIINNLNTISKKLGNYGVNVVMSGAPAVGGVSDVTGSTSLALDPLFKQVQDSNPNVTVVDAMSPLLNQKNLVDTSGFHMNNAGQMAYDTSLSNAVLGLQGKGPVTFTNNDITQFVKDNNLTPDQAIALAPSFGLTGSRVAQALAANQQGTSAVNNPSPSSAQFFGNTAPGAVGVNYGQANSSLINQANNDHPELTNALSSGNVSLGYNSDTGQNILINSKTGQEIPGNYTVSTSPTGGVAINLPLSNGAMVQVASGIGQNGQIAPVTASNVYNVGTNAGAGGFAGGISDLKPLITKIGMAYAGNALGDYLNPATNMGTGNTLANLNTGISDLPIGDLGNLGNNSYSLSPTDLSNGLGQGLNATANLGSSVYDPLANTAGYNSTGLQNGLGLQAPGAANLASMGGGQGLTIPTATGASTVNNATLGATGTVNYGAGGLPVNPLTGQTLGTALNNLNTGVTVPSSLITNSLGNVAGTPLGTNTANGIIPAASALGAGAAATNALGLTPLQTALGATALAGAIGTKATNNAISNAANTQATAANNVNDVLGGFYSQYAQAQQPYQNLGTNATQQIAQNIPYLTHQFNAQDLQSGLAPNYDFMLQQGLRANQNAANVSGGLLSGNTLQGMQNYTQNYAQNAYQNAFNNYQTQRQNIYGNLSNVAGLGQTSLGQLGQVGSNLAQTYGNVTTGLAASQAGAQTAQAVNNANLLSNLAKTGTVLALA